MSLRDGLAPRGHPAAPALVLAILIGACATAGPAGDGRANASSASGDVRLDDPFVREIGPFPVLDAAGRAYEFAFLGGFDVPRPQLVDPDGDGDLDLFVQERTGELIFFENVGAPDAARFVWRTDRYRDLDVGEWSRFVDMDRDGDLDLFAELPFSYARYFRNDGSPTEARFVPVGDSLRDVEGTPVFADRQNIPSLVDVDCNGRMDLFLGRVDGTVTRYEEAAQGRPGGAPLFRLVTERFEDIQIIGRLAVPGGGGAGGATLHGANSMAFGDIDDDGDPDLVWGDFFEPGLLWIRNFGTCESPDLRTEPVPVPAVEPVATSGYNAPWLADLDADGDLDMMVGVLGGAFNADRSASDNLHYYEMGSDGRFALQTVRYLYGIDTGSESTPALADLDRDGDLDLVVGDKLDPADPGTARLFRFENVGSATEPRFELRDSVKLVDAYHYAPSFADLDGDGVPELLLGTWNDGVYRYRWLDEGNGTGRWQPVSADPLVTLPRGSHTVPAAGDLDGDGDLDLLVGESSGEIDFFRNVGTSAVPRFELVTEALGGVDVGRRSAPVLVDLDHDGDLDLVVGREDAGLAVFLNQGDPEEPRFVAADAMDVDLHGYARPAFADLDGDGDRDLVVGGSAGGLVFFRNRRR